MDGVDFERRGRRVMMEVRPAFGRCERGPSVSAAGGFWNATPANREHCAVPCGGSYNGSGGRTRSLFRAELRGH